MGIDIDIGSHTDIEFWYGWRHLDCIAHDIWGWYRRWGRWCGWRWRLRWVWVCGSGCWLSFGPSGICHLVLVSHRAWCIDKCCIRQCPSHIPQLAQLHSLLHSWVTTPGILVIIGSASVLPSGWICRIRISYKQNSHIKTTPQRCISAGKQH